MKFNNPQQHQPQERPQNIVSAPDGFGGMVEFNKVPRSYEHADYFCQGNVLRGVVEYAILKAGADAIEAGEDEELVYSREAKKFKEALLDYNRTEKCSGRAEEQDVWFDGRIIAKMYACFVCGKVYRVYPVVDMVAGKKFNTRQFQRICNSAGYVKVSLTEYEMCKIYSQEGLYE